MASLAGRPGFLADCTERLHQPQGLLLAKWLLTGAVVQLLGMVLNRFDVSWFAVQHPDQLTYIPTFMANNVHYIPSLPEVFVSVGIFSFGILAFGLAVKYLPVFEHTTEE